MILFIFIRIEIENEIKWLLSFPSLLIQTKLHMPATESPLPEILRVGDSVMNINLS